MLGTSIGNGNTTVGPVAGKRAKVTLKPGRSLMDWIRLGISGKDIQGFNGEIKTVSMEELAKHNTENDCWMLLRGKVYNLTAYTEYHPGGIPELMRAAGKDGTAFFDEVHKWVNIESMLAKCFIGPIEKKSSIAESLKPPLSSSTLTLNNNDTTDASQNIPRFDWYQSDDEILISIYTKRKETTKNDLILDCANGKTLDCKIIMGERYYQICIELENEISSVKVQGPLNSSGKFELKLTKTTPGQKWDSLGKKLHGNNKMQDEKKRNLASRNCKVCDVKQITSNTKLFTIQLPDRVHYESPIGHHVLLEGDVQGMKIGRNYTVALPMLGQENTTEHANSSIHIMLKIYDDGALTPFLDKLKVGDIVSMSDCTGDFQLERLIKSTTIFMVAAGTGLTPMIRIIDFVIRDKETPRKATLLFANRHESDILWRDELDKAAEKHNDVFNVDYILSKPPNTWKGMSGRIDKNILSDYFSKVQKPEVDEELLICICGPIEFTEATKKFLMEMEFPDQTIHCFLG